MKRIEWTGSSLDDLKAFPQTARREAGHQLNVVQEGLEPFDSKPMPAIGAGVKEIRVRAGNQYRIIYVAKFTEAVYVLHCFTKKTQKTRQQDIDLARKRYNRILKTRGEK